MNDRTAKAIRRSAALGACLLAAGTSWGAVTELYFRAGATTNTMPDGRQVVMWGFARDSGPVQVPGPAITLGPGSQDLLIHLTNGLPEPVSIVIPGQPAAMGDPVRNPDGRARSFTHEAPPGGTADYSWSDLRPGTYLYHSGSHPAVQVQMGLYGPVTKDAGFGEAYPGVPFNSEVTLLFSEIDPVLHNAVATDDYGPGKAVTSTIDYRPAYFLIDGISFTNGLPPVHVGRPGDRILLRLLNAGLDIRVPMLNNTYVQLVAEDGNLYPYTREAYSITLPPLKTTDAILTASEAMCGVTNIFALYDRRGGLVNSTNSPGGMLTYLAVYVPGAPTDTDGDGMADTFETAYFGGPTAGDPALDPDGDGMNNYAEFVAGTDPGNPFSLLAITGYDFGPTGQEGFVTFATTVADRFYDLQYRTNLLNGAWLDLWTDVPGYPGSMYLSAPRPNGGSGFYRVRVDVPWNCGTP